MARPTEFDRPQAIAAAQKLFWRQGYHATSLADLLDTMGIGRGSFYAAFGDKRSLFVACLTRFSQRTRGVMERAWEQHRSALAFAEFFQQTMFGVPERRLRRGCMMVNTLLELADVDQELNSLASRHLGEMESLFAACFEQLQADGAYPRQHTPEQLAASLMVVNQGLRVASRRGAATADLQQTVDATLSVMGLPAIHTSHYRRRKPS